MDYDRFLSIVAREAGVDHDTAERATRDVVVALAHRAHEGPLAEVTRHAPEPMRPWFSPKHPRETFDAEELVRRVAEKENLDIAQAARRVRAVFYALSRAIPADVLDPLVAELPKDFDPLLGPARRPAPPWPIEEFLSRVADRAGIDLEAAARATEATLEILAERIAGGEVRDLSRELPPELHPPLQRGDEASGGLATRMTLDEFVERIAKREDVPVDVARVHARAVLSTVRDAVQPKEFHDLASELPRVYIDELCYP
ncbi:DUF2267 domain-containing protein [Pseudonocardia acidicola]|uniref:DUF2267 domain-containing protein n=1 Tax=Pseudonocardia acidicola TaxID=2724939 RepID=A0ABX1SFH8_9PSEU|nr:DUF2267 domain-containing protein [Pseudonocardia acidicola]NMH99297.1 DUF2267 domain-containing protein [Pseudonocardia acidicola]